MKSNSELDKWIEEHNLDVTFLKDGRLMIDDKTFTIIKPKPTTFADGTNKEIIIDQDFNLVHDDEEMTLISNSDYILYQFGNKFYYNDQNKSHPQFKPFKWLGIKPSISQIYNVPHLGIRGGYELLSGSGSYEDYCKKAKFLQCETLGICEKNTLAGTLAFQFACKDAGIKPVIGETVTLLMEDSGHEYDIKLFVMNDEGWRNLLQINAHINVHNERQCITHTQITKYCKGLIAVGTGDISLLQFLKRFFAHFYYQIDTVEYSGDEPDHEQLKKLKTYVRKYFDTYKCALINDSFYLDKQDAYVKKYLHKISNQPYHNQSDDQYYKDIDESIAKIAPLFEDEDLLFELTGKMLQGTIEIADKCNFEIPTGQIHLPKFIPKTDHTSRELFYELLIESLENKGFDADNEYVSRLEMECDIIEQGGFIDYFLILWDIVQYCKDNGIKWGIGRGSAGGSLVSYLLGITHLDPLRYGLLFERFLNAGRISKKIQKECIILNGGDVELDFDEKIIISRNGQQKEIFARDLEMGDQIIKYRGMEETN